MVAAIKRLAACADRLERELRDVFGVEIKTFVEDHKLYQDYCAKLPDNLVIYSRSSDRDFYISAGKQPSREKAIARIYYRLTEELSAGQSIRKYKEDGSFEVFGYSRQHGAFYRIDPNKVVANRQLQIA